MAFKTNKLVVTSKPAEVAPPPVVFEKLSDVPGIESLTKAGYNRVTHWISENLHLTDLVLQAVEHKITNLIVNDAEGNMLAAYGWRIVEHLGKGKDGHTFLAYRFSKTPEQLVTVKFLSTYGLVYLNHSKLFNNLMENDSNIFIRMNINETNLCMSYKRNVPFKKIEDDQVVKHLPKLCEANSWAIKNTGFVFWDFGFSSGKNYMLNRKDELYWIDYGGAGMLRAPNFPRIYQKKKCQIAVELEAQPGKENLVIANSDFIMCQFLFHIEYWNGHTTIDIWSSMLQMRKDILPEIIKCLDTILKDELAINIYKYFYKLDWAKPATWDKLAEFINENT